ncbi:hypothetical protein BB560_004887, partial [Smittium megazygosporum]
MTVHCLQFLLVSQQNPALKNEFDDMFKTIIHIILSNTEFPSYQQGVELGVKYKPTISVNLSHNMFVARMCNEFGVPKTLAKKLYRKFYIPRLRSIAIKRPSAS